MLNSKHMQFYWIHVHVWQVVVNMKNVSLTPLLLCVISGLPSEHIAMISLSLLSLSLSLLSLLSLSLSLSLSVH